MENVVFISGIKRGIGKALAQVFLENDWHVHGTSRSGEVDYAHENLFVYTLDVTNEEQIAAVVAELEGAGVQIDLLINNAGVLLDANDDTVQMDRLRATLEVNLFAVIGVTQALLPLIKEKGTIFNMSSSAGQLTREMTSERYPGYKISKTALNMYTVSLAKRLEQEGITVASIHPGWVRTDMGGDEGQLDPQEAAQYIYEFVQQSDIPTGKFWHRGEQMDW